MTRFEDLPPVDLEGWLADQGRHFLQRTDQTISRLGLPDFLSSSQKKINQLGTDLSGLYSGLESSLSRLPSAAQQASSGFLASTGSRIGQLGDQLGTGLNDLGRSGALDWDALGNNLERGLNALETGTLAPVTTQMGPLGNLPRAVRAATDTLGESNRQYEEYRNKTQGSLDAVQRAQARGNPVERNLETLGLLGNAAGAATTVLGAPLRAGGAAWAGSQFEDRPYLPGVQRDTPLLGGLTNPVELGRTIGEVAAPATLVDDVAEVLIKSGLRVGAPLVQRLVREVGEGPIRQALRQGEASLVALIDEHLARLAESPAGQALGRLATDETGGGPVGGGMRVLRIGRAGDDLGAAGRPQGLYASLTDRATAEGKPFVSPHADTGDTEHWGTLVARNPLELQPSREAHGRFRGGTGEVSTGIAALKRLTPPDEFARLMRLSRDELLAELRAAYPGVPWERFGYDAYELLEGLGAQRAREAGHDALILRDSMFPEFDEAVALTDDAIRWDSPARASGAPSPGPLRRLAGDESGALRLPQLPGRRPPPPPSTPGVPVTPGPSLPPTASEFDRAYADRLRKEAAQQAAAQTPVRPNRLPEGSVLSSFDRLAPRLRRWLTDETAYVGDLQREVTQRLAAQGRSLASSADAVLKRRLYAGRQAASAARIEDDLLPHIEGLDDAQALDVETTLEQLDEADRARAVQNRVTAQAAGQEVGPVAGETALRNQNQSVRMRRANAVRAQDAQDAADRAYQDARDELSRVRAEGRREVRGSQGRGRRRLQRTPEEQARVEAEAKARLDAAAWALTEARAARRQAEKAANVQLSRLSRADLSRMRQEAEVEARRIAAEGEIAQGAAQKGAEAAANRVGAGGVSTNYAHDTIWEVTRQRIADRLGANATPAQVDAELARIRQSVEGVQGFSRALRETMYRAGMISRETYDKWEQEFPNYIRSNLLEYLEHEAATPTAGGGQTFTVNSMTGGGMNLGARMGESGSAALREQPINVLIRMTSAVETIARRNEAAKALEELVQSDPTGELQRTFRPLKAGEQAPPKHTVFSVYKDGEPVRYAVPDRFRPLFALDEDANRRGLQLVGDWLGAGVLKAGATTYNPGFVLLNAMRDAQVYARRAIDRPGQAGEAAEDLRKAYADLAATGGRGPAEWREALRLGAGQSDAFAGRSPQQVRERLLREGALGGRARVVRNPKDLLDAVGDVLSESGASPFSHIRRAGEIAETAPRLAAYRRALRAGKSPEEAALAARDITLDFSRGGTATRSLNKLIPFLNAAVQGQERFVTDWVRRPKQTAIAAATGVLLPTIAAEAYNRALFADDYADVPSYLKDSGIVVMLPGDVEPERRPDGTRVPGQRNFLYLPLPQDMALLRGAVMRSVEATTGQDPGGFASVARSILGNASPVPLEGGFPLPPVARVAYELQQNRDVFRGRDIVPEYVQGRPERQQATDQTSALGRVLGEATGKPPAAYDYAIEGLAGGLGRQALRASDLAARAVGRGDLASQGYSSAEGGVGGALDLVRGVPLAGDVVGRVVRGSGGQQQAFADERLNAERTAALERADARLEAMPSFRRLPQAQQQRLRDQEYAKINREFQARAKALQEARSKRRVAVQARD